MDLGILTTSAVSLLVPYLKKFTGNEYASQSLKRLEEKPQDEDRQVALKGVLKETLTEDPQFQKMVSQLLAEAKKMGGDSIIQVYGSGAAATHGGVAAGERGYAAGGNINIGRAPSEDDE